MKVLISGSNGQDGSYLSELLVSKGHEVHGIIRRSSTFNTSRIDHLFNTPETLPRLHYGDMLDGPSLERIISNVQPDWVFNLAAQSHVRVSFDMPEFTHDVVAMGTLRLLEAIRRYQERTGRQIKLYQASSSEQFGNAQASQNELTPFQPCSPYAVAKTAAHHMVVDYRKSYNLFACCGILFNHEGPRRGETFVTRKITRAIGRIKEGLQDYLYLGNLEAKRDWGYAKDYVTAMEAMLSKDNPGDYVIATGESHSVREFCEIAFNYANLDYNKYVKFDSRQLRPNEVNHLEGDASKAARFLNWIPTTSFNDLVKIMVDHDHNLAKQEALLKSAGY